MTEANDIERAGEVLHGFNPDWTVHPGQTLVDILAERDMTQAQLARATGFTTKHVNEVCRQKKPMHARFAVAIESVLRQRCARLLLRIQADHDEFNARQEMIARLEFLRPDHAEDPKESA